MKVFFSVLLIVPLLDWVGFENLARGREVKDGRDRKASFFKLKKKIVA